MTPVSGTPDPGRLPATAGQARHDVRPATPRDADAARAMAQAFELQMIQGAQGLGSGGQDPFGGSGEDDGGDDPFGLGSIATMSMATSMLPALAQAGGGKDLLGLLLPMLLGGGGAGSQALGGSGMLGSLLGGAGAGIDGGPLAALAGTTGAAATTPAASAAGAGADAPTSAGIVARIAAEEGVDPVTAVAVMLVESGGDPRAVGDGGTSFGLFQLHDGGMLTAAGLSPDQAYDPATNARVALRSLAHEWSKGSRVRTPGEIAAASQRPADPVGYAAKVDASMERARQLVAGA